MSLLIRDESVHGVRGWVETPIGLGSYSVSVDTLGEVIHHSMQPDALLEMIINPVLKERWFRERLIVCRNPEEYYKEMQSIVDTLSATNEAVQDLRSIGTSQNDFSDRICRSIETMGYNHLMHIESDFKTITLRSWDTKKRVHTYIISFPRYDIACKPSLQTSLPVEVRFDWSGRTDINLIKSAVEATLASYADYFDVIDDIDIHCRVLEPLRPTYAIGTRRIALDRSSSVTVIVDPIKPKALCDMTFLGPTATTTRLRSNVHENAYKWSDTERSFCENLKEVLDMEIPAPDISEGVGLSDGDECGICYSFEDPVDVSEGVGTSTTSGGTRQVPDQICSNEKCARRYHKSCLLGWLQSVPSSRTSFGTVFGVCPYCSENMSVKSSRF